VSIDVQVPMNTSAAAEAVAVGPTMEATSTDKMTIESARQRTSLLLLIGVSEPTPHYEESK